MPRPDDTAPDTASGTAPGETSTRTPDAAPAAPAPAPLADAVEVWFAKHFHGLGPKLSEELYNVIHAAKDELLALVHGA